MHYEKKYGIAGYIGVTQKKKCRPCAAVEHGASLCLKFEGVNLSIVIIFKTFHWFKNDESYSVVSVALLCVSLLLRQRKVMLCCCEATILIIAELTYTLTYQIIISLIPSIPDFVYTHFAQKK